MSDLTAFGLPADLPEIAPPDLMMQTAAAPVVTTTLTAKQKAAVVVRVLATGGERLALSNLPDELQAELAKTMGGLKSIGPDIERQVVAEFLNELDNGGGRYGGGLTAALELLDGSISRDVAQRLGGGSASRSDPWPRLADFPTEKITGLLETEGAEVAAICLSKLPSKKAAEVLAGMDGPKARRAAFTVSRISSAQPDAVRTIGQALLEQLNDEPVRAFTSDPAELVGSMLLSAKSKTRDDILDGLKEEDEGFADRVRGEIFIFGDIADRIEVTDVPKILRGVDQAMLQDALKFSTDLGDRDETAATFILDNMSKRMAAALREEMEQMSAIDADAGEEAQGAVVEAIQDLVTSGEITLRPRDSSADGAE